MHAELAGLNLRIRSGVGVELELHHAGEEIGHRGGRAAIGNVRDHLAAEVEFARRRAEDFRPCGGVGNAIMPARNTVTINRATSLRLIAWLNCSGPLSQEFDIATLWGRSKAKAEFRRNQQAD